MKLGQNPYRFKLEDLYASEERVIRTAFGSAESVPLGYTLDERFFSLYQRQIDALFSSIRCLLCHGINPCFPIYFSHYVPAKPCLCPSVKVRLKSERHQQLIGAFRAFLTVCFPPENSSSPDFKTTAEITPNVQQLPPVEAANQRKNGESSYDFGDLVGSLKKRRVEREETQASEEEAPPLVLYLDPY